MKCNADIATAKIASMFEGMGVHVDADAFDEMGMEAKAAFAKNSNKYDTALAQDIASRNPKDIDTIASGKMQKIFGSRLGSFLTLSKDPGIILGEHFIQPLQDALQAHIERYPDRFSDEAQAAYKADVLPVVKDLQSRIQDNYQDNGHINYANRYLQAWQHGGRFYNMGRSTAKDANYLSDTITRNLVSNNPFITLANVFEFMPKALGVYGVKATGKGMLRFLEEGGLKGRIPELADRAVYDTPHKGLFGKFDLINLTETPLRGLSYYVAEAAGHDGLHGVEKIAFKYRPGREPLVLLDHGSAASVALMRFSIESAKMYGQWYKNILDGKLTDGAYGLALFHAMTAIQTGGASSVPAPVWGLMNEDQKESVKELDDHLGTNLLKHLTGQEFEPSRMQPAGGVSFGLGYDLANSAINQGYRGTKKAIDAAGDGDYTMAGVDFAKAMLSGGQAFVPGLNTSVRKIGDIILDTLSGETAPEEVPGVAGKKLIGLNL